MINDSVQARTSKFSSDDFLPRQTLSRDQIRITENPPSIKGAKKKRSISDKMRQSDLGSPNLIRNLMSKRQYRICGSSATISRGC